MADTSKKIDWDVSLAITLWKAGHSGGDIASRVGTTRSAILGFLWRRGFTRTGSGTPKVPKTRKPRVKKAVAPKTDKAKKPMKPAAPKLNSVAIGIKKYSREDVAVVLDKSDFNRGFPIISLKAHQCRYPISADNVEKDSHLFCGEKCADGEIYCSTHRRKIYRPTAPLNVDYGNAARFTVKSA
jgi:hypothetical protein